MVVCWYFILAFPNKYAFLFTISSLIESSANFSISDSKYAFSLFSVSDKITVLIAQELLMNPVNKNNKRSNFCALMFNLSIIFVSNATVNILCQN